MPSPLDPLLTHLVPSLANVAPEKIGQLQDLLNRFGITFVFDDETPAMVFTSDHDYLSRNAE